MNHDEICKEISGELEDVARWVAGGGLSPEEYRVLVDSLEERKLKRFGLRLSSIVCDDRVQEFSLRFAETDELCARMDVDPATGSLARLQGCLQ